LTFLRFNDFRPILASEDDEEINLNQYLSIEPGQEEAIARDTIPQVTASASLKNVGKPLRRLTAYSG
jgi:hypothetical protein